jgi:hypothetical protein
LGFELLLDLGCESSSVCDCNVKRTSFNMAKETLLC